MGIDLKKIAEGAKDIDLAKVDPSVTGLLGLGLDATQAALSAKIEAAQQETKAELAKLAAAVAKGGAGGAGGSGGGGGGGDAGKPPAAGVADELAKLVPKLQADLEALKTERQTEAQRAKARAVAEGVIAAKYPNLRPVDRAQVLDRAVSAAVADAAAVETIVGAYRQHLAELGVPQIDKVFSADPVREGARPDPARAKLDEEERIAEIRRLAGKGKK